MRRPNRLSGSESTTVLDKVIGSISVVKFSVYSIVEAYQYDGEVSLVTYISRPNGIHNRLGNSYRLYCRPPIFIYCKFIAGKIENEATLVEA